MRRLLSSLALLLLAAPAAAQEPVTAFIDVTVVPMDRQRTVRGQTVLVRGPRIVAMGPSASITIPAGATRVDGRGKWLMPGLSEMHAHVPPGNAPEALMRHVMLLYVANGVTTIRGMLGAPTQLGVRDRIMSGEMLGPTFYVAAPSLNGNTAPTPAAADSLVRAHKRTGYDLLKLHPGLTRPAFDAIVRAGREVGITYGGHVSLDVGLAHAMAGGQATVDHLDGYLEAASDAPLQSSVALQPLLSGATEPELRALAGRTREAGMWNVPTEFLWESFHSAEPPEESAARPEMRYATPQWVNGWINQKRQLTAQQTAAGITRAQSDRFIALRRTLLRALADSGAPLLLGTDSPQMFNVPGFALHREMETLAAAGLTPWQILESGTRNVGRYAETSLRMDGRFGTVAAGQRADLLLLDADPLADVRNVARRAGVMVRGRWLPASEITALLEASRAAVGITTP